MFIEEITTISPETNVSGSTNITAWKVFKYGVFSGPYFPVCSPNTGKYGSQKSLSLNTFHAVITRTTLELSKDEFKKSIVRNHYYTNLSFSIIKEVGKFAMINGIKSTVDPFSKLLSKHSFKRITANTRKIKLMTTGEKIVLLKYQVEKIS